MYETLLLYTYFFNGHWPLSTWLLRPRTIVRSGRSIVMQGVRMCICLSVRITWWLYRLRNYRADRNKISQTYKDHSVDVHWEILFKSPHSVWRGGGKTLISLYVLYKFRICLSQQLFVRSSPNFLHVLRLDTGIYWYSSSNHATLSRGVGVTGVKPLYTYIIYTLQVRIFKKQSKVYILSWVNR